MFFDPVREGGVVDGAYTALEPRSVFCNEGGERRRNSSFGSNGGDHCVRRSGFRKERRQ